MLKVGPAPEPSSTQVSVQKTDANLEYHTRLPLPDMERWRPFFTRLNAPLTLLHVILRDKESDCNESHSLCKLMFLVLICLTLMGTSNAQDTQRVEIFGGYSLLHDNSMLYPSTNFNGWDSSATVFVNRWFGVTGDVFGPFTGSETQVIPALPGGTAGKFGLSSSSYTFMLGPHFTYHRSRYAPFCARRSSAVTTYRAPEPCLVPVMCGPPVTCGGPANESMVQRGFAMALGGGLDIDLGHGISFRPVQAEYLLRRAVEVLPNNGSFFSFAYNANDFRYSTGIVFHFGRHLGTDKSLQRGCMRVEGRRGRPSCTESESTAPKRCRRLPRAGLLPGGRRPGSIIGQGGEP